ncbi:uncharacterized protein LOC116338967 isoform X2 [Contarinia nasturtii]|uniref:uncharacterized protein LOC116338967 isoform X2 n=1 Tax=Contarinia nasturtii TaxID=265458 RepID=UPI0012D3F9BB|nr:uncharacterized protein LOC116338967 isoform X2 [Contarinia nasturtii]
MSENDSDSEKIIADLNRGLADFAGKRAEGLCAEDNSKKNLSLLNYNSSQVQNVITSLENIKLKIGRWKLFLSVTPQQQSQQQSQQKPSPQTQQQQGPSKTDSPSASSASSASTSGTRKKYGNCVPTFVKAVYSYMISHQLDVDFAQKMDNFLDVIERQIQCYKLLKNDIDEDATKMSAALNVQDANSQLDNSSAQNISSHSQQQQQQQQTLPYHPGSSGQYKY